jgi:hypothetical protein
MVIAASYKSMLAICSYQLAFYAKKKKKKRKKEKKKKKKKKSGRKPFELKTYSISSVSWSEYLLANCTTRLL